MCMYVGMYIYQLHKLIIVLDNINILQQIGNNIVVYMGFFFFFLTAKYYYIK